MPSPRKTLLTHRSARRNSAGEMLAPLGRLYLWFPTEQAMAKVVSLLRQHTLDFESAEGDSLVVDVEWSVLRDIVGPMRRLLTHGESEDTRVLYKPAGGALSIGDFPTVKSYAQFALVSQSTWLRELIVLPLQFFRLLAQDPQSFADVVRHLLSGDADHRGMADRALFEHCEVRRAPADVDHQDHVAGAHLPSTLALAGVDPAVEGGLRLLEQHEPIEAHLVRSSQEGVRAFLALELRRLEIARLSGDPWAASIRGTISLLSDVLDGQPDEGPRSETSPERRRLRLVRPDEDLGEGPRREPGGLRQA